MSLFNRRTKHGQDAEDSAASKGSRKVDPSTNADTAVANTTPRSTPRTPPRTASQSLVTSSPSPLLGQYG